MYNYTRDKAINSCRHLASLTSALFIYTLNDIWRSVGFVIWMNDWIFPRPPCLTGNRSFFFGLRTRTVSNRIIRLHRVHEMRTIAIDDPAKRAFVSLSVNLSVCQSRGWLFLLIHIYSFLLICQMAAPLRCGHYSITLAIFWELSPDFHRCIWSFQQVQWLKETRTFARTDKM